MCTLAQLQLFRVTEKLYSSVLIQIWLLKLRFFLLKTHIEQIFQFIYL